MCMVGICYGLTQQAAKHHRAIHSLPPSQEENWKQNRNCWLKIKSTNTEK